MTLPLRKGRSKKVIRQNIGELVHSYEKTGRIGNSRPKSKKKAVKQAVAIAYKKAGRSRKSRKKR